MEIKDVFTLVILLIVCLLSSFVIEKKKIPYLHESALCIFLGMGVSLLFDQTSQEMQFDQSIFFTVILPPIIFSAGYTLKKEEFFQNFGYILLYGLLGTLLAFSALAFFAYILSMPDWILSQEEKLSVSDCMLLACILASTDTVAALTLVKAEQFPKLNSILFGEGIVNDAVSILLFNTVKIFFVDGDGDGSGNGNHSGFSFELVLKMLWQFVYLSFFSLLIGIGTGLLLALMFKYFPAFSEKPKLESSLILLIGYSSYLLAESYHFSGIMSLFSCGLVMSHYTMQNLSDESKKGTVLIFDSFGYIAETFVFIYLGMTIISFDFSTVRYLFSILMIFGVAIARMFAVFVPPAIVYVCCRREVSLTLKEMKIIWYSGLVRGAIAFALGWLVSSPREQYIRSTTLVVVLTTTIILANFLSKFAKHIGLGEDLLSEIEDIKSMLIPGITGDDKRERQRLMAEMNPIKMKSMFGEEDKNKQSKFSAKLINFESKYLQPIFGSSKNLNEENENNENNNSSTPNSLTDVN